ncbi:hypothetical protein M430DRAFT_18818 [Amorphotheca resinae ATCC 22711]|uniref:Uncharacterized protein n=1 Tax=Amorphotheca resinae ATCC 22711 TaxID=857342 RepID=A0A2T3B4V6_AMORE|nr:hypothetical protein M430DRAFT_18818 [Amorphotheca resinae ATCC 22711]PSS20667.1 hypothetical protein M430DRAFT_18818 [Amorphotheca resinae ATCC 22711]
MVIFGVLQEDWMEGPGADVPFDLEGGRRSSRMLGERPPVPSISLPSPTNPSFSSIDYDQAQLRSSSQGPSMRSNRIKSPVPSPALGRSALSRIFAAHDLLESLHLMVRWNLERGRPSARHGRSWWSWVGSDWWNRRPGRWAEMETRSRREMALGYAARQLLSCVCSYRRYTGPLATMHLRS